MLGTNLFLRTMKIFETDKDLVREEKAINKFVSIFSGSYEKMEQFDIDYKVYDSNMNLISYVEIKGRNKKIENAYPLPISVKKLIKLSDKKINPVIIWSCEDGIIYGKLFRLEGKIKYGGRPEREGSCNDNEIMAYYEQQEEFKTLIF